MPGLAAAYLWAAPTTLWRRIRQLLAAGVAIVVSAGWWLLAVALWPADRRPYIGGSTNNSPLELAFGYNGLGRIFGGRQRRPAASGRCRRRRGRAAAVRRRGHGRVRRPAGLTRMFSTEFGGRDLLAAARPR